MSEQNNKTAASESTSEKKASKVDFAKKYSGKEVMLSGKTNIWGFGNIFNLSVIPDDEGSLNNKSKVPENAIPTFYEAVNKAVESGVLIVCDDASDKELQFASNIKVQEANKPEVVEELIVYDELLSKELPGLERELETMRKEGKKGKEFYQNLFNEEKSGLAREEYLEAISKMFN